jgi:hypothetical protein
MKFLLIFVLLSTGERTETQVQSLAECQRQARAITGDQRSEATYAFVAPNGKTMATCRQIRS